LPDCLDQTAKASNGLWFSLGLGGK
jgi:hypothetical protein